MSYLRFIPSALLASILFFHFPHILGVVQIGDATTYNSAQMPKNSTPPTLSDLYVSENLDGGAKLQLSDGTVYEIHPDDRDISSAWLLPSNVTITASKNVDYPLLLTNTVSKTSIKARKFDPSRPLPNPNPPKPSGVQKPN